ncbi:sensor domain-containing diguanylate cyclase [Bacillaceae bacterium IKA-2]|nr:sensor domain-containing diguanylate cyclase [Bacillaceae bacterium IKA-2]
MGGREPLLINDTSLNGFTRDLPLTYEANIHSYLGVPISYKNGDMFGTLCAIDSKIAKFTEKDIEVFQKFSNLFSYVIELEKKVQYDCLTDLFSRTYLYDNFNFIADKGTLMLIDLDRFKEVNDVYGHDVGDKVLREVGKRIKDFLDGNSLGARLGGDEFVILFPNLQDHTQIEDKANCILSILSDWKEFSYDIGISASIGVVKFPCDGVNDIGEHLKKADIALYQAKEKGKNCFHF